MPYATLDDVIIQYKPIQTMIGASSSDVSSVEVASVYIARAESYVDAWLARRYVTPLNVTPPLITQITADLSIFNMLAEKLAVIPEFMDKRKARCDDMLKMLAEGVLILPSSVSVVASQGDNFAWSPNMDYHPIFSPVINELDQTPDMDRVNADLDERSNELTLVESL